MSRKVYLIHSMGIPPIVPKTAETRGTFPPHDFAAYATARRHRLSDRLKWVYNREIRSPAMLRTSGAVTD